MQEYFIFCMEQMMLLRAWDLNAFALRMNYVWVEHPHCIICLQTKTVEGCLLKKWYLKQRG